MPDDVPGNNFLIEKYRSKKIQRINLMEDDYIDLVGTADSEDYEFFNPSDEEDSDDCFA